MDQRPSLGDIVAASATASAIGVGLMGIGIGLIAAISSGDPSALVGVFFLILIFGFLVALLTAWPIGTFVGWMVLKLFGWGYRQATLAGATTGLIICLVFTGGAPSFDNAELAMLLAFFVVGALSGALAWRAVTRAGAFRERY